MPAGGAGDVDRYPQLLSTPGLRWWQPLLGLLLAGLTVVSASVVVILAGLVVAAMSGDTADPTSSESLRPDSPLGLLANNLVLATLVPASALAVLVVHRASPGLLASVTSRVRWSFLLHLLVLATAVVALFFGAGFLLPADDVAAQAPSTGTLVALFAVILLTTPVQAAAEEVGFRGYLSQAVASWFARPVVGAAVAAAVSALLFALAHGVQDAWLFGDRLCFGLVASWLVWRTGGLEPAVALHVANNMVSLGYSAATGTLEGALTASSLPWSLALLDVAMMVSYAVVADRLTLRWGIVTRRPPPSVLSGPTGVGYPFSGPSTPPPAGREHPWGMG